MASTVGLKPLELTPEERVMLKSYASRRRTAQGLAMRARIILRCADGGHDGLIARELRIARGTVGTWRRRFAKFRLDGLHDEPRPGAPRTIIDGDVERVIVATLESAPKG